MEVGKVGGEVVVEVRGGTSYEKRGSMQEKG